jgi:hypothetical protein
MNFTNEKKLKLTIVTPPLNNLGIKNLRNILSEYSRTCTGELDVVCNDWGVLHFISREFPEIKTIIGRTLNKSIKELS